MSKTIKIEDMGKEISKILQEYAAATEETCEKAIVATSKETVKKLKQTSPKDKGDYAKSWTYGNNPRKRRQKGLRTKVIYNKKFYMLTHLLEKGHKKRNGGVVSAQPHIGPAEEFASDTVYRKIKEGIARQ